MSSLGFTSIEAYLASQDAIKAETTRGIIEAILTEFPGTNAVIAWNVPQIKLGKE